jgi:hypothetical protein
MNPFNDGQLVHPYRAQGKRWIGRKRKD